MARRHYSSIAARTTLASGVDDTTTTFVVTAVSNWPASYPYTLIVDQDTVNEEIVEVTARSGTTLTVTRGVDGSSAVAHSSGAAVNHGVSARDFDEPNDFINGTGVITSDMIDSIEQSKITDLTSDLASKVDYALPTNAQTGTTYTFVAADAEKLTTASNAAAVTLTIPPASSVAWPDNTVLRVVNYGAGAVTIDGGSGVTVTNTATTIAQYGAAVAIRTGSDAWTVVPFGGGDVPAAEVSSPAATGQYTDSGTTYDYYTFTASGTLTVDTAGFADVLVVGGGGGGGGGAASPARAAGGGGAGGFVYSQSYYIPAGTQTVTVGAGGVGGSGGGTRRVGSNGRGSRFATLFASGGGGGGGSNGVGTTAGIGNNGASGGGGSTDTNNGTGGSGDSGQGSDGGSCLFTSGGGGGGGASAAGGQGTSGVGGDGGDGSDASFMLGQSALTTFYAGGGGGGSTTTAGAGGDGGGGTGANSQTAGGTNTGGGGGGGGTSQESGANGGSGIVIVRVKV